MGMLFFRYFKTKAFRIKFGNCHLTEDELEQGIPPSFRFGCMP